MKILVACEESQAVTKELRRLGHEAYSCDIEPCSGGRPEWHIQRDVLRVLNPTEKWGEIDFEMVAFNGISFYTMDNEYHMIYGKWDMILAFPPCTYLSNAGAKHLFRGGQLNQERYQKGIEAKAFFMAFLEADCPHIAVENPVSSRIYKMPPHSQEIQPWQFGHHVQKKTRLWLKGLPKLEPTEIVEPKESCHDAGTWFNVGGKDRQKNRAKTFPGVARAMAEQWAGKA